MTTIGGAIMAYNIVQDTTASFIENPNIQLPRFQRSENWSPEDNFKLCISVFKGYPIGVVIINSTQQPEQIDWLLDGRQRRNALIQMMNNPVEVYRWAQKFVKFNNKGSDSDIDVIRDKFFSSINNYLQNSFEKEKNNASAQNDEDLFDEDEEVQSSFDFSQQYSSLTSLCDLITIVHPITNKKSKLEKMFSFNNILSVQELDYSIIKDGDYIIDIPKLWVFVKFCVNNHHDTKDEFTAYLIKHYKLNDQNSKKIKSYIEQHWEYFDKCFKTWRKCDNALRASTVGIIKLTNATPLDTQNIFSLVNAGGTPLTAEELLSARPFWNNVVNNPSSVLKDDVKKLYEKLSVTVPTDVYRWDLCASLMLRIDKNHFIFEDQTNLFVVDSKNSLKKPLSLGFKTVSALLVGGINNNAISKLERKKDVDWNTDIDKLISEINIIISIIEDYKYFKYLRGWKQSVMSLTSNTIAIEFIAVLYKRWKELGSPQKSDAAAKKLAKEAFILYDRLVYEYSIRIWVGSSDNKLSADLANINSRLTQVSKGEWKTLIDELATGEYKGKATKSNLLKPLRFTI